MEQHIDAGIPIDKDIREQADLFFKGLGISLATIVNAFIRQVLREGQVSLRVAQRNAPGGGEAGMQPSHEDQAKAVQRFIDGIKSIGPLADDELDEMPASGRMDIKRSLGDL
jgi:antitoxin component of RelBE/YafQ-DinJ toxin-antitoxin module